MARAQEETDVRTITAQRLTQESFEPFGDVLSFEESEPLPIDIYGDDIDVRRHSYFESDQPVEFLITRSRLREFQVQYLERHVELTQTFIPLEGHPFIIVVAPPDASETDGIPSLEQIRAFFVPGRAGVNLRRGTWHEVPFPLVDGALQLVTSHQNLTRGLESGPSEQQEIHEKDVEKRNVRERANIELRVELP